MRGADRGQKTRLTRADAIGTMGDQQVADLARRYKRFAEDEVRGQSPRYEAFARGVTEDPDAIQFLLTLPKEKQQPNLLFASVRLLFGVASDWPDFRRTLLANAQAIRAVMLTHSTQTNEPARCAALLPVFGRLPQPLAIIEVGASAGLCLLPDHYGYRYGRRVIRPMKRGEAPLFACAVNEATPLPDAMPRIIWRAGLDLNPLGAADPEQVSWLEALVWPEQAERLNNLRAALNIAAAERPRIVKGDLRGDSLAALCTEAPRNATLVVFHTAVLAYVAGHAERHAFSEHVRSLCHVWIANETPGVLPEAASRVNRPGRPGWFLLSVNGSPVAWTHPHGAALEWMAAQDWTPDSEPSR